MRHHAAGIFPLAQSTGRFMVTRRSLGCSEPLTWSFPCGMSQFNVHYNRPENPYETAVREFIEETFTDPRHVFPLGKMMNEDGTIFHVFLGIFGQEFSPRLNWENDRFLWLDLGSLYLLESKHHEFDRFLMHPGTFETLQNFQEA